MRNGDLSDRTQSRFNEFKITQEVTTPPSTFYGWLRAQSARNDDVGALARYVAKDRLFPKDGKKLFLFLLRYEKYPEQYAQVKRAHREWRRVRKQAERAA